MSSDIGVRFRERIHTLRKERTNTTHMAEHVGMDRSFVSDLENEQKEVCIRSLAI